MQKLTGILLLVSIFCSCRQNGDTDHRILYGKNPSAGKYYEIRGFKMYVETYGEGEPLLLIHGNAGSIKNFINQIPFFSKKYKVIIADSRGQGQSEDKSDTLTFEMMADDYAALLSAMKIDSAFVIGWSDGGINALLLAGRHPEKVKKLVATGANLWPDSTALVREFIEMIQPYYSSLKATSGKSDSIKRELKLLRLMIEEPQIPLSYLSSIKCPALIIGGDHDIIRGEHTMLIYKNISKAYLWILPNSGHSTLISYKNEFNKTVDDFFSKPYREITGKARLD